MSKCMTIDEAIDQTDTCTEITAKNIVEIILEEVLHSVVILSDKGCSRIGDFNITEDFCQQFDQLPAYSKEFDKEKINHSQNLSGQNQDVNLDSGEIIDHSVSLLTARENLEFILDSLIKKDDKSRNLKEYTTLSEEALVDGELRIENGQIHLDRNKSEEANKTFLEAAREEYFREEDVIKDEKIEIEYVSEGKINKIYVPLREQNSNIDFSEFASVPLEENVLKTDKNLQAVTEETQTKYVNKAEVPSGNISKVKVNYEYFDKIEVQSEDFEKMEDEREDLEKMEDKSENVENTEGKIEGVNKIEDKREDVETMESKSEDDDKIENQSKDNTNNVENTQKLSTPFTTEMLRQSILQVWGNVNSSVVGRYDGDMLAQTEEVVRLMEEISGIQLYPEPSSDPNRPRACTFAEEDVKKIIKEISELNFNPNYLNSEDTGYHPDGQGDADLESKSFIKSKEEAEKSINEQKEPVKKTSESDTKLPGQSIWDQKEQEEYTILSKSYNNEVEERKDSEEFQIMTGLPKKDMEIKTLEYPNISNEVLESELKNTTAVSLPSVEPKENLENLGINDLSDGKNLTACEDLTPPTTFLEKSENSLPTDSDVASEASRGNIRRSHSSGKELELSEKDSTLLSDKDLEHLKGSHSLNNTTDNLLPLFPEKSQEISKNSQNSDKEIEMFSLDSKFFLEKTTLVSESSRSQDTEDSLESNLRTGPSVDSMGRLKNRSSELKDDLICVSSFSGERDSIEKIISEKIEIDNVSSNDKKPEKTVPGFPYGSYGSEDFSPDMSILSKPINGSFGSQATDSSLREIGKEVRSNGYDSTGKMDLTKISSGGNETKTQESEIAEEPTDNEINQNEVLSNENTPNKPLSRTESENLSGNMGIQDVSSTNLPQKLKLESRKMYSRANFDPARSATVELNLTDSEEALIDLTENILQIIEPPDDSNDESSNKISFSLFDEMDEKRFAGLEVDEDSSNYSLSMKNGNESREIETKKTISGMTTIGPIKNPDYDPKDLTGPEIDFGKMRRITSSRQLAKDIFGTELSVASSVKILEEDDSDQDSLIVEGQPLEVSSLVNRDIASLTKVQRVREVMSYHPKPEDDFEDEENLTRTRLDLKDVESMTDERYKMTDVNIPLLSFEVGDANADTNKNLIESMRQLLTGNCFDNNPYFDIDEDNPQALQNTYINLSESFDEDNLANLANPESIIHFDTNKKIDSKVELASKKSSRTKGNMAEDGEEKVKKNSQSKPDTPNKSRHDGFPSEKYGTLGSVFKKASSRLIHKDGQGGFARSTKSLPRDTSKLIASDSIRSIIDDCHASASNVLKKSRSLLKNTQNIFKTISQNRFSSYDSPKNIDKQKSSPSESDVSSLEKKLSTLLRKEDFTKAKNIIKNKVEKTFKSLDSSRGLKSESDMIDGKNLRVALRNEDDYRMDKMDNFKKLLPKSPLIYKSQFVKSQASMQNTDGSTEVCNEQNTERETEEPNVKLSENFLSENSVILKHSESEKEIEISFEEKISDENVLEKKLTWLNKQNDIQVEEKLEIPEFIVMETVEGLPNPEFEVSTFELPAPKDKISESTPNSIKEDSKPDFPEIDKVEITTSLPATVRSKETKTDSERFSETEETIRNSSERKIKKKSKKFSARFRSFWCSTFGRVKTSPKKSDSS